MWHDPHNDSASPLARRLVVSNCELARVLETLIGAECQPLSIGARNEYDAMGVPSECCFSPYNLSTLVDSDPTLATWGGRPDDSRCRLHVGRGPRSGTSNVASSAHFAPAELSMAYGILRNIGHWMIKGTNEIIPLLNATREMI